MVFIGHWGKKHETIPVSYTHLDVYKRQVRNVPRADARLKEAEKLGFISGIIPPLIANATRNQNSLELKAKEISRIQDLVQIITGETVQTD